MRNLLSGDVDAAINPALRRSYDLRGVAGTDLTIRDARAVGLAFASLARRQALSRVAVSRDGRLSSPALEEALVDGLVAGGAQVFRLPVGPTPLLSFAIDRLSLDGGIMVTGSHNPANQNGFKLLMRGEPVHGAHLAELWEVEPRETGGGAMRDVDLADLYIAALRAEIPGGAALRVAWDSGNGATGEMVERLARALPGRHIMLHTAIDGRFPNHHPDPSVPENLGDLATAVVRENCDLGIAFDGDGDRIGAVDETGVVVWADQLQLLLARDVLRERPGSTVVGDVKSSGTLFGGIAAAGGRPVMGPSGYVLVREQMLRHGAPLAGEMSGHIFFSDRWHGSDDGLYVAMRLLRALARSDESLREFRESLPRTAATPELRLPCPDADKTTVIESIAARLQADAVSIDRTDGIRVTNENGWWLLRASGTEPKLTIRCEAKDEARLARLKSELAAALRAEGIEPDGLDQLFSS